MYLPFMAMPNTKEANKKLIPVSSGAICAIQLGVVGDVLSCPSDVVCPLCRSEMHAVALDAHMATEHNRRQNSRVRALMLASAALDKVASSGGTRTKRLWAVKIKDGSHASFSSSKSVPIFAFQPEPTQAEDPSDDSTWRGDEMAIKAELPDPDFYQCRFCPKRFTSLPGNDAHCDARHSSLKLFACPNEACKACFDTKLRLLNHLEFACGTNTRRQSEQAQTWDGGYQMLRAKSRQRQLQWEMKKCRQLKVAPVRETSSSGDATKDENSKERRVRPVEIGGTDAAIAAAATLVQQPVLDMTKIKAEVLDEDDVDVDGALAAVPAAAALAAAAAPAQPTSPCVKMRRVADNDVPAMITDNKARHEGRGVKRKAEEGVEDIEYEDRRKSDSSEKNIAKRRQKHPQVFLDCCLIFKSRKILIRTQILCLGELHGTPEGCHQEPQQLPEEVQGGAQKGQERQLAAQGFHRERHRG